MKVTTSKTKNKQATERLEARVPTPIKELIGRAASIEGVTLTDFVISSLQRSAIEVVREHELLRLSVTDSHAFARVMLDPPKPSGKLAQVLVNHSEKVQVK